MRPEQIAKELEAIEKVYIVELRQYRAKVQELKNLEDSVFDKEFLILELHTLLEDYYLEEGNVEAYGELVGKRLPSPVERVLEAQRGVPN